MKRLVLDNKADVINQIQDYLEKNSEAKFIHRLQVVLLFAGKEEESCDSLGELFGNSPRSISNWIKRINRTGNIETLRSRPQPGRTSRLTKEQKDEIKMAIQGLPETCGIDGKQWNGKNLSIYISRQYGVTLNVRSCQRLFYKLGISADMSLRGETVRKSTSKASH